MIHDLITWPLDAMSGFLGIAAVLLLGVGALCVPSRNWREMTYWALGAVAAFISALALAWAGTR